MKNIAKALLEAQKKIKNAERDGTNPHFRSGYASLESVLDSVKDVANECGLVIAQTFGKDPEGHYVETKVLHETGEILDSRLYLVLDKPNMQGLGSAITYGRRYSLAAMFSIGQEDDDGNKSMPKTEKSPNPFPQKQNQAPKRPVPSGAPSPIKTNDQQPPPSFQYNDNEPSIVTPTPRVDERIELGKVANIHRKRLNWDAKRFGGFIIQNFNKPGSDLTIQELQLLIQALAKAKP